MTLGCGWKLFDIQYLHSYNNEPYHRKPWKPWKDFPLKRYSWTVILSLSAQSCIDWMLIEIGHFCYFGRPATTWPRFGLLIWEFDMIFLQIWIGFTWFQGKKVINGHKNNILKPEQKLFETTNKNTTFTSAFFLAKQRLPTIWWLDRPVMTQNFGNNGLGKKLNSIDWWEDSPNPKKELHPQKRR